MVRVGLIGDYKPNVKAHIAIPLALRLASETLGYPVAFEWTPTASIRQYPEDELSSFDALWAVPASPYESMAGALRGIRYAREHQVPFLGTCGGFQHMLIEYARNVLQLSEADHAETNPDARLVLVSPLTCCISEQNHTFVLTAHTKVADVYGMREIVEQYGVCHYGLNPEFRAMFEQSGLSVAGTDTNGDVRIMELEHHPFFVGTLFQPERSALHQRTHPLIQAFVQAAHANRSR